MGEFIVPLEDQVLVFGYVLVATVLGALVGTERRRAEKPAGTRTHALVAASAALVTSVSARLSLEFDAGDPTRGVHAVITGIGFLGAGAIMQPRKGRGLQGLTTAASVFYTAALGVAVAAGFVFAAAASTALSLLVLRLPLGRQSGDDDAEPSDGGDSEA
jgi:putative Mg2+ transporter-C (MgtC) family protein